MNRKKKKLVFTHTPSGTLWFFKMGDVISDRLIYDFDQKKWLDMIDFFIRPPAPISS